MQSSDLVSTTSANWVTQDTTASTYRISLTANTTGAPRSCTITISVNGYAEGGSVTLYITQPATNTDELSFRSDTDLEEITTSGISASGRPK